MAKKPTTRKSTAKPKKAAKKTAKPKTAKKAKVAKPKTAKKVAKPKTAKKTAKPKTAKKTAKRKATAKRKSTAKRAKAPARKKTAKRSAAPAAVARVAATPANSSDKDHLISVIQSGTGSSKKAAADTLAAVLNSVAASLKKNQKVQLVGFGTFDVVRRRARTGRNPATGAPIKIKASKGVRFKAGSKLKAGL
jgi:DNA-binding protein HU-beta